MEKCWNLCAFFWTLSSNQNHFEAIQTMMNIVTFQIILKRLSVFRKQSTTRYIYVTNACTHRPVHVLKRDLVLILIKDEAARNSIYTFKNEIVTERG